MAKRKTGSGGKGLLSSLVSLLSRSFLGRLLLYLVAAALVCVFDLLVSSNRYDLFYRLVGAEFLLFAAALWIVYIVKRVRE